MTVVSDLDLANERIEALMRENKILREELAILKRGMFGRRSETIDRSQLALFAEGEGNSPLDAPLPQGPPAQKPAKEKTGHGRAAFAPELARDVIELDIPEAERVCACCGKALQKIGEEITERGHIVPAQIVVRRYVRPKYACPDGHGVKTAALPDGVIDGGKYEASVHAHVVASKYQDHLPLHRLEGIFKRRGMHLSRQTMWDMVARVDELVASPVLPQMRAELLAEDVLHADEMPITICVEDGKGSRTGYAWGWRNLHGVGPPKVLIEFRLSRGREGPRDFLGDWKGTLITDGYAGYDEVVRANGIVRSGCWAHARRKVKEAFDTGSRNAAGVLQHIQELFAIEREAGNRAERGELGFAGLVEERRALRETRSRPLLERIFREAEELGRERGTLPKSKLGKALTYLERQQKELSVFLGDPRLPIHNNDEERDLRHLAVGRNNWLVFASQRGGEVACRLYSLVLSCKQSGIDAESYIEDMLNAIGRETDVRNLTPWAWAARRGSAK